MARVTAAEDLPRRLDVPAVYRLQDQHDYESVGDYVRSVDRDGRQVLVERRLAEAWGRCGVADSERERLTFDRVDLVAGGGALMMLAFLAGLYVGMGWSW